jgi:hypothetical protein
VTTGALISGATTATETGAGGSADQLAAREPTASEEPGLAALLLASNSTYVRGGTGVEVASANAQGTTGAGAGDVWLRAVTGDVLVNGAIAARDVALRAEAGAVTAQAVSARDDIVLRASGAITTGDLTSGTTVNGSAATDSGTDGAGDVLAGQVPLSTPQLLTGNDIDGRSGTSITTGLTRALGAGSDIRLEAPVINGRSGSGLLDIDLSAEGDVVLVGVASARDVAIEAGGAVTAQAINATDDIAIRAGTTATTGALTSGAATATESGAGGSADQLAAREPTASEEPGLAALLLASNSTYVRGGTGVEVASANAQGTTGAGAGDVWLRAVTGDVLVNGAIAARDVALRAEAGAVTAQAVSARDDIVLRASGAITTGDLTSGTTGERLGRDGQRHGRRGRRAGRPGAAQHAAAAHRQRH